MKHQPHDNPGDHAFDDAMRALHAQSLERLSPNTRLRLRPARRVAEASRAPARPAARPAVGWVLATGCAAVFAVAIGLQLRGPTPATSPTTGQPLAQADTTASAYDDSVAVLDENPDLYLWLAANDEPMPALE